jgi:hypothetical protein
MTRVLTGVGCIICAAHVDAGGRLHGHTYEVTAWFPRGDDAIDLQGLLKFAASQFDHCKLPPELSSGEALCVALASKLPNAVRIDVSRPAERIYARWEA